MGFITVATTGSRTGARTTAPRPRTTPVLAPFLKVSSQSAIANPPFKYWLLDSDYLVHFFKPDFSLLTYSWVLVFTLMYQPSRCFEKKWRETPSCRRKNVD